MEDKTKNRIQGAIISLSIIFLCGFVIGETYDIELTVSEQTADILEEKQDELNDTMDNVVSTLINSALEADYEKQVTELKNDIYTKLVENNNKEKLKNILICINNNL